MSFYKEVPGRQTTIESTLKFDTAPTAGSTNPVTSDGVKSAIDGAVGDASEALQEQIDEIAEKAGSGYIPKGEASVATLNGLSGQENGWLYTMTDSGTLTDGSLAVVAGDTVAWDEANSVWYKAMDYAPRQYGTNEVHNLPTSITAFRTGDVIPVDGPSGTAKMAKDDLLRETAQNALINNLAPVFDPNKTADASGYAYHPDEFVIYEGALKRFTADHVGAWNNSHAENASVISLLNAFIIKNRSIIRNKFEMYSRGNGSFYQSDKDGFATDSGFGENDMVPSTLYEWLLADKFIFEAFCLNKFYFSYGSWASPYDPYKNDNAVKWRLRSNFFYTGEFGSKLHIKYSSSVGLAFVFFYKLGENGKLQYAEKFLQFSMNAQVTEVDLEPGYIVSAVFGVPNQVEIPATDVNSVSLDLEYFSKDFMLEVFPCIYEWEQGGISGTGAELAVANRIRTRNFYECLSSSVDLDFQNPTTYTLRVIKYDSSKTFVTYADYTTPQKNVAVTQGGFLRFVLFKKDDANLSIDSWKNALVYVIGVSGSFGTFTKKPLYEESIIQKNFILFEKTSFICEWEQGAINASTGSDLNISPYTETRIRTRSGEFYECLSSSVDLDFQNASTYTIRVFVYDSDKIFTGSWYDCTAPQKNVSVTQGYFLRFVLFRKDGANISVSESENALVCVSGISDQYSSTIFTKPLYSQVFKLKGKKVAFIGDSITAGAGSSSGGDYVNQVSVIAGCTSVNLGVNGTCIANNTKNGLGSSRFVTRATSTNLSDVDLVVVFGGTNDLSYDSKAIGDHFAETTITASGNIGTKQLGPITDTDTFAGALHDLITTIQGVVTQGTPILFVTPLHRNNNVATNPNSYQCNSNGDFMIDFVNAIKDICGFYAIPVLDLYADGEINPLVTNYSYLFSDGLHPNNKGHRVIAERIVDFVENNISFIS